MLPIIVGAAGLIAAGYLAADAYYKKKASAKEVQSHPVKTGYASCTVRPLVRLADAPDTVIYVNPVEKEGNAEALYAEAIKPFMGSEKNEPFSMIVPLSQPGIQVRVMDTGYLFSIPCSGLVGSTVASTMTVIVDKLPGILGTKEFESIFGMVQKKMREFCTTLVIDPKIQNELVSAYNTAATEVIEQVKRLESGKDIPKPVAPEFESAAKPTEE